MEEKKESKLIILGSGPAGYTSAIYASRANLNPLLITGPLPGGLLTTTLQVDNWPGESEGIQGPSLMEKLKKQALRFGTKIVFDHINRVNFSSKPFSLFGNYNNYQSNALIIATGSNAKYLGLKSEKKFIGRGVSVCATCDGFFYKNKDVVVVGGGNTAVEESLFLSNIVRNVTIIHRRDCLRAEKFLVDRLMRKVELGNVKIKWNSVVTEILGNEFGVTGITLKNIKTSSLENLDAEGVFIAIGHTPNTKMFSGSLEMNKEGYLKVKSGTEGNATQTSIKGIYAAGDVMDSVYRQAITSAGTGSMAALDAEKYINGIQ